MLRCCLFQEMFVEIISQLGVQEMFCKKHECYDIMLQLIAVETAVTKKKINVSACNKGLAHFNDK